MLCRARTLRRVRAHRASGSRTGVEEDGVAASGTSAAHGGDRPFSWYAEAEARVLVPQPPPEAVRRGARRLVCRDACERPRTRLGTRAGA